MSAVPHDHEPGDTDLRIDADAKTLRPSADIDFGIAGGSDIPSLKPAQASSLGAGHLILVARELTGLSQRKLAAKAGASQPALAKLETGNGLPSIRTLLRIAEAAGFQLVIGLRRPKSSAPDPEVLHRWGLALLGVLQLNPDDGLADFVVLREPSPLEGPR